MTWGAATRIDDVRGAVAIAGVGEADHTGASGRDALAIGAQAVERALADCGLTADDVDGIMYRGGLGPQLDGEAVRAPFGTRRDLWVSHEGGAMTWAGTAPAHAARAIRDRKASVVVNVFSVDWASRRGAMRGGPRDVHAP